MKYIVLASLALSSIIVVAQTPAPPPTPQITTIDELKREYADIQKDIKMDTFLLRDIPAFQDYLAQQQKLKDLEKEYQQIQAAQKPAPAATPAKK